MCLIKQEGSSEREREAAGCFVFSFYKDPIKLQQPPFCHYFKGNLRPTPVFTPSCLPPHRSAVGYSQVFQGLKAGEGFLGHRFDLVSKQGPAVKKHAGRRLMEGEKEEGGEHN